VAKHESSLAEHHTVHYAYAPNPYLQILHPIKRNLQGIPRKIIFASPPVTKEKTVTLTPDHHHLHWLLHLQEVWKEART
jgi:hypothetical protein